MESHSYQLGNRLFRILSHGAGQSIWIYQWDERISIEDHPGGDHPYRLFLFRRLIPEGAFSLEIPAGLWVPAGGCIYCF